MNEVIKKPPKLMDQVRVSIRLSMKEITGVLNEQAET